MKYLLILFTLLFSVLGQTTEFPVIQQITPFYGSRFFVPQNNNTHTSVIMLHGSEGGSEHYLDSEAMSLAKNGFAVLLFCYFDCDRGNGIRKTLKNVEVTNILNASYWLKVQPRSNKKVVVYGFSRGSELALITGSISYLDGQKGLNAIIAHSPSDVFNGPWNWSWANPSCWLCKAGSGKCSSASPKSDYKWNLTCGPDDPNKLDFSKSAWLVLGKNIPSKTRIEIERFRWPILITVGNKDEVWPVEQTKRIENKLKSEGKKPEVHYFSNEGHVFKGNSELLRRQLVINFINRLP